MPDWAFYRHSGIRASMYVHCPGPCCISKSILHVHVHVACSCQWCISCQCFMSMSMSNDIYIEMPECRTVRHPVSPVPDWKKLTMPKPVRYRTKLMQSGIFLLRYRTKIRDAGMPMPALVSSMPMPSYAFLLVSIERISQGQNLLLKRPPFPQYSSGHQRWAPTTTLRALNIFLETLYEECSYDWVQTWYCTQHFVFTGIYLKQELDFTQLNYI
jgi:hypothetical protein